jgi:hypothetical protein
MSDSGGGGGAALSGEIVVNFISRRSERIRAIEQAKAEAKAKLVEEQSAKSSKKDRSSSPRSNMNFDSPPSFNYKTPSDAIIPKFNQKIKLVPECKNNECDAQSSSKCRSTNYLEPLVAISCCYDIFGFDECAEIFKSINDAATAKTDKTVKFDYEHSDYPGVTISFSNATRAMNHYKNFLSSRINKSDNTNFLKEFEKSLKTKYKKVPTIKTCYIGYIPKIMLIDDADNSKHQVFSDVFFLMNDKDFFGVSCKAEIKCPLSNWWVDSYLWHCNLKTEYRGFVEKIKEREQQYDEERYKIDEKYKATMRSQWNDEDRHVNSSKSLRTTAKARSKSNAPSRSNSSANSTAKASSKSKTSSSGSDSSRTSVSIREPIFKHGTVMDYIQQMFKRRGILIARELVSDVFAQTMHYDVFLAVAGKTPKCLVLTDYYPDTDANSIDGVELDFSIRKATAGKHSKFIFGINVSFINKREIFKFHVEIRRSGSYNDYRIHIILDKIVTKELPNNITHRAIESKLNKTKRSLSL